MNIIERNLSLGNMTYGNKPNTIVLHHAESSNCTVEDINRWHKNNGWAGIGYHYFVRKDGSIYKGRPDNAIGAHAKGHNTNSLGVCAEGRYMTESMPQVQKDSIIELCKYLKNKYGISRIYGHRELMSTDCPGVNYPLQDIKNAVLNGQSSASVSSVKHDDSVRDKTGTVTASVLNVRYTPGGKIIGTLKKGSKVKLWRLEGDWYHIYSPIKGYKQAYVHKNYVSLNNAASNNNKYGMVTASALNVRAGAGTNYRVIGQLQNGAKVRLDKKVGNWWSIYFGNHGGFVSADYIKLV